MAGEHKKHLWLATLLVLMGCAIGMGFGLVWLNVERNDLAYSLRQGYERRDALVDSNAKLENQRDALLSPHVLGERAKELGMRDATVNQIRHLDEK